MSESLLFLNPSQTSQDPGREKELEATRADGADRSLGASVWTRAHSLGAGGDKRACSTGLLAPHRPGLSCSGFLGLRHTRLLGQEDNGPLSNTEVRYGAGPELPSYPIPSACPGPPFPSLSLTPNPDAANTSVPGKSWLFQHRQVTPGLSPEPCSFKPKGSSR